jgi:hypothetical protein
MIEMDASNRDIMTALLAHIQAKIDEPQPKKENSKPAQVSTLEQSVFDVRTRYPDGAAEFDRLYALVAPGSLDEKSPVSMVELAIKLVAAAEKSDGQLQQQNVAEELKRLADQKRMEDGVIAEEPDSTGAEGESPEHGIDDPF